MGPRKFWGNSKRKTLKPKEPLKIYLLCSRHPWKQKKRGPPSFWTGDKSESPVGSWIFLLQASGHPPSPLVFEKANQRNPPFEKKNRRPPPGLCSLFGQNTDQTQGHTHIKHPCTPASTVSLSRLSEPAAGRGPLALCQKQRPAAPPLPFGFFFFQQRRPLPVQQRRLPPADPAPPPNSPTAAPLFLRPNTAAAPAVLFPVFSQSHRAASVPANSRRLPCSYCYFWGVYSVILELLRFCLGNFDSCSHCKHVIMGEKIVKEMRVIVFFFMYSF